MSESVRDRNVRGWSRRWEGGVGRRIWDDKRAKCECEDDGAEEGRKAQGRE